MKRIHIIRKASCLPLAAVCSFLGSHALSQETTDRFKQASDAFAEIRHQREMEGFIYLIVTAAIAIALCIGLWFLFRLVYRKHIGANSSMIITRATIAAATAFSLFVVYRLNVVALNEVSKLGHEIGVVFSGQADMIFVITFLVRSTVLWLGVAWSVFALLFIIARPLIRLIVRR